MLDVRIKTSLEGFRLDVEFAMESEVFALLGASGSGKSLTLSTIAGFVTPDEGRISIDGEVLFDGAEGVGKQPERRRMGYVLQEPYLFPHYTVLKNLTIGRGRGNEGPVRLDEVIDVLNLSGLQQRKPRHLSGGEKQRVAIGRALLSAPEVLLMDEPVSSLDEAATWRILTYIKRVHERFGIPILYVTHSMDEVEFLADSVALLDAGTVVAQEPKDELLRSGKLFETPFRRQFSNLLKAEVVESHPGAGLTTVRLGGKQFEIPVVEANPGDTVLLSVPAGDILVSAEHPAPMSASNIYCGEVKALFPTPTSTVALLDAGFELFVEVSPAAMEELNITVGEHLHYILKSGSFRIHSVQNGG